MQYGKILRPFHVIIDLICLIIVSMLVSRITGYAFIDGHEMLIVWTMVITLSWVIPSFFLGAYYVPRTYNINQLLTTLFKAFVLFTFFILFFVWLLKIPQSRYFIALNVALSVLMLTISHLSAMIFMRYIRSRGRNIKSVVIVGHGDLSQYLQKRIKDKKEYGYSFKGYFDDNYTGNYSLGKLIEVIPFLVREKVDIIYCYPVYVDPIILKEIICWAEDNLIKVKIIPDYRGYQYNNMEIEMIDDIPVLGLTPLPLEDTINLFWKRSFDIFVCLMSFILVAWWLFPIVAIAIKLESKGPVFFRQLRGGRGNEPFKVFKFRTMKVHDDTEVKQATRNDSRITVVGRFLRRSSIDELPQLINVLLGEMSFVGPRPHALKHNEEFRSYIDKFNERHAVKPGITGLAQAKGYRGEIETTFDLKKRIRMDLFYVRKWSFLLDVKIIIMTIWSMLKGQDTAY